MSETEATGSEGGSGNEDEVARGGGSEATSAPISGGVQFQLRLRYQLNTSSFHVDEGAYVYVNATARAEGEQPIPYLIILQRKDDSSFTNVANKVIASPSAQRDHAQWGEMKKGTYRISILARKKGSAPPDAPFLAIDGKATQGVTRGDAPESDPLPGDGDDLDAQIEEFAQRASTGGSGEGQT
jgi:hypothetical protein